MPNWIEGTMKPRGKRENIKRFLDNEILEEALNPERGEWLKGAVIHLSQCLREIGDQFGIVNAEVDK